MYVIYIVYNNIVRYQIYGKQLFEPTKMNSYINMHYLKKNKTIDISRQVRTSRVIFYIQNPNDDGCYSRKEVIQNKSYITEVYVVPFFL